MRIIKNNLLEEVWPKEVTCGQCGSVLEVQLDDMDAGFFDGSYLEEGDFKFHITCPVCGWERIHFDEAILPKDVRVKLAKHYGHKNPERA